MFFKFINTRPGSAFWRKYDFKKIYENKVPDFYNIVRPGWKRSLISD